MQWSMEQLDIFYSFLQLKSNLMVNASPGSGKTTVSKEIWALGPQVPTLQLAFNKDIVEESIARYPVKELSRIQTFNSLGAGLCYSAWKSKLNNSKIWKYIREVEHRFSERRKEDYKKALHGVVSYAKSNLSIGAFNSKSLCEQELIDLIEYYDLDSYRGIERDAAQVLWKSCEDTQTIDFADQLLLPVLYGLKFPFYELVLVDEAQDVNSIQREMLRELYVRNPSVRYVYVGDSHQAIYAFRGALADSMRTLGEEFTCTSLPLTITHRCPKSVVQLAQLIWPESINPSPEAREGVVRDVKGYIEHESNMKLKASERKYDSLLPQEEWRNGDLLLCRTTAPLISFAYQLLRANIPCQVRGRDIGKGFINYIEKSKCLYVSDLLDYMERDIGTQVELARMKRNESRVQALLDKQETLELFSEVCQSMYTSDMIAHIENLFAQDKGIVLSTIHKAKGLEAEKVYILAPDLMPHPLAQQEWEKEQERNIEYVAVTRSKEELVFI